MINFPSTKTARSFSLSVLSNRSVPNLYCYVSVKIKNYFLFVLVPGENIATMKYGAQVVKGELKSALLDGDTQNYDLDHGFSRHPIDDDCRSGIEIKLGQPSIINHIRILLWDRDSR